MVDPEKTAKELAKYIDLKESEIYKFLQNGQRKVDFKWSLVLAGRDITVDTKKKIEKLKLPGITFTRNMKRFYPNGIFASHVVGFTETKETKKDKSILESWEWKKVLNDVFNR